VSQLFGTLIAVASPKHREQRFRRSYHAFNRNSLHFGQYRYFTVEWNDRAVFIFDPAVMEGLISTRDNHSP